MFNLSLLGIFPQLTGFLMSISKIVQIIYTTPKILDMEPLVR